MVDLSKFSIYEMNFIDLNSIKDILESEFDNYWNYSIFKTELENPNSKYYVLKNKTEIIGFAGILIVLDEAEITNIVIKKAYRSLGLSKLLMDKIINYCSDNNIAKIHLEVNSSNLVAINLYKHFGFKKVGLRKNYYKNGDAILLTKLLDV